MEQTNKKAQPNQSVRRVKLFKTNKGWMTAGITTMALAAGAVTFAGTNNASAATWKARSVSDIVDQIKTATTKSTYTIKWGDTLETIAQALEQTGIKTSADRLAEINHIAKADVIYAGNKLTFTGTGSTAVATVKQSDGTKKSYNLNPSKQAQASTKDVQEAKQSQQKVAAKAAPVVQAKADTSKTSAADKTTDTAAKSDDAKAATDTAAKTDDTAATDSSAKFEQAVKDAGYTYTKTDDGQYSFELTSGSASDVAAIKQLASDNQITNYQYTDSKLTALTADLQAIGVQVKSASGAYTFTAKDAAQASAAKKLIAASGLSSKYSLTLVQADATSEDAANTQAATTADDGAATETATTSTAATTATKSATTSAAATTTAKTATTSAATTTPAKSTTSSAAASTTAAKTTASTTAAKATTTAASTTAAKTSTTAKATTTAAKTTTTAAKTTATTTTTKTSSSASRTAKINAVIALAKKQLGKPYSWGAKGPSSFDCSGLMYYVFLNATGKNIGGYTVPQESAGTQVSVSNLQAGDLVFWGNHGNTYHVALYLGGGQYLEAPKPGYNVRISTLSSYFMPSFGVRVF